MCSVLKLPRGTYYYESQANQPEDVITPLVVKSFKRSRNNYGTRKIKVDLGK